MQLFSLTTGDGLGQVTAAVAGEANEAMAASRARAPNRGNRNGVRDLISQGDNAAARRSLVKRGMKFG